MKKKNSLWS